ncbi:hypothetical protein X560_0917 [Listeria fleischmannii 1991]|uniref:ABC-type transport system involved in multi-copper enzyme maturation, permease component n=2 Tax=Listeria fleischmannii TaxID=1069827 RepID=A0A2X3HEG6_9LIST|nr:hypothetical protein [Listeria fleischmannii]EMG27132.1 hypothetical protein LFLEISCH_12765 [Listeria fleischmannii subsp. fleischmannii LU2006-1]KMT59991.1 hypothetical protein X560_0917 [Listeria fleischmannii 1991]SQC70661.1 ABC-type transport system involved in multi-copper enzyme maturation, permease component [Listeria fleischmannii subsp. fleischmannii]
MFSKGLWYKEWQSSRWILLLLVFMFLIGIFGGMMTDANTWADTRDYYHSESFKKEQESDPDLQLSDEEIKTNLTIVYLNPLFPELVNAKYRDISPYYISFTNSIFFDIIKIAVFALGLFIVAFERFTRKNRFTAMLPYKRWHVITVKLTLGIAAIIAGLTSALGIGILYFQMKIPSQYLNWEKTKLFHDILGAYLSFILIFLVAVAIGLCIASPVASLLIGVGALLFPVLLVSSVDKIYMILHRHAENLDMSKLILREDYLKIFSPFEMQLKSVGALWFFFFLAICLVVFILFLFQNQKLERNGQLFAFNSIKWVVYFFFALSSGLFIANAVDGNIESGISLSLYITIALVVLIVAFLLAAWLVRRYEAYFQMAKSS